MNRRGLLKLFPLAALGIAVQPQVTTAATVIESRYGRKVLRHYESQSGHRVCTMQLNINVQGHREVVGQLRESRDHFEGLSEKCTQ